MKDFADSIKKAKADLEALKAKLYTPMSDVEYARLGLEIKILSRVILDLMETEQREKYKTLKRASKL